MKKSFVYLIAVLMLAGMLCGCGMDADEGVIGASPRPTDEVGSLPSMMPEVSPTIIPDGKNTRESSAETSNPQVGTTDNTKPGMGTADSKNR